MPSRWLVVLRNPSRAPQLPTSKSVQSLVRTWLARRPGSTEQVPGWADQPFSAGRPFGAAAFFVVPVRLLVDELQDVLTSRVVPGRAQRWNEASGELVADDYLYVERIVRESAVSWDALTLPTGSSTWRITHETPATHQRWGGHRYECLQGIEHLLSRPARLYASLRSLDLTTSVFADKMALAAMELRACQEPAPLTERSGRVSGVASGATGRLPEVHGTLGWSEWYVRDPEFRRHVDAVLRVAEFTGVGHFTSAGFGAISVQPLAARP